MATDHPINLDDLLALRLTYRCCADAPITLPPRRRGRRQPINTWFRDQLLRGFVTGCCLHLHAPRPRCTRCDPAVRARCPLPLLYPPLGGDSHQPRAELASLHSLDVLSSGPVLRLAPGDEVHVDLLLMGPAQAITGELLRGLRTIAAGRLRLQQAHNVQLALHDLEAPGSRWPLPTRALPIALADAAMTPVSEPATQASLVAWLTATGTMELTLRTPLRLTHGKRGEVRSFEFAVFATKLFNRLHALGYTMAVAAGRESAEVPWVCEVPRGLIARLSAAFSVEASTQHHHQDRRGHGGHHHPVGGLRGVVRLTSADPWALRTLAQALVVGAWVGVGRCATMGLGRLRVRPVEAPAPLATPVVGSRGSDAGRVDEMKP